MNDRIINNIKSLSIDMINEASSGHPGIALGATSIIYTIFSKYLNYSVKDDNWVNRDRFVLSAGHGSALLYATMYMAGYNISLDDLKKFRTLNSKTPGHPEYGVTPGVECTTGPLGQGIATSVGMAISEKVLENRYKIDNGKYTIPLVNYKVYTLVGDGDLMEGVSYEACSLAGNLKLDNLIVLYDSNGITLDGELKNSNTENIKERFEAMNWHYELAKSNKVDDISKAIDKASKSGKPAIIEVKTIIGEGSYLEGTNKVHGAKLEEHDLESIKLKFNYPEDKFYVDNEAKEYFTKELFSRSMKKYELWARNYREYVSNTFGGDYDKLKYLISKNISVDVLSRDFHLKEDLFEATRVTNGRILNELVELVPDLMIGGSADLASSTKTNLEQYKDITRDNYNGKNIWYGVREHGMAAIMNGIALSNLRPFGSTFLSFSDYMKPSIRLSALMNIPVTYIFTHDSINVGEDGPTHEPIEQLAALRSIPNLNVYRPADAKELIGSWHQILNGTAPSALILSRVNTKLIPTSNPKEVSRGAYLVRKEAVKLHGTIIATGTEVNTALEIAEELYSAYKLDLRVVSMPCMELFDKESVEYQKALIPEGYKTFVIEAGSSFGWGKFVYNSDYLITLDSFGKSGKTEDVLKYMNFDKESIKKRIINMYK